MALKYSTGKQSALVCSHWFRRLIGEEQYHHCGHYVDSHMIPFIVKLVGSADYPPGNHKLSGHTNWVTACVVSMDGLTLFTGSDDGYIIRWCLLTNAEQYRWEPFKRDWVRCLDYSGRQGCLACGSDSGSIVIWDVRHSEEHTLKLEMREKHDSKVSCIKFVRMDENDYLITASSDRSVRMWDCLTGAQIKKFIGHTSRVTSLIWCERDDSSSLLLSEIVSVSEDPSLKVWPVLMGINDDDNDDDASEMEERDCRAPEKQFYWMDITAVSMTCDGNCIVTCTQSEMVVLSWPDLKKIHSFRPGSSLLKCHPTNPKLIAVNFSGTVRIVDLDTEEHIEIFKGHYRTITDLCFTPDGHRLVSVSFDSTVQVWDVSQYA